MQALVRHRSVWALPRWSAIIAILALAVGTVLGAGSILVAPSHRKVLPPPAQLHGESVTLTNRSDMLARAELLWNNDFAVLALDLQAHGESTGAHITYGHRESQDVEAAVRYLRQRFPALRVGGIGVSLGGAALVLAGRRVSVDAAVLEAVYPSIAEALDNRIRSRVGPLADFLSPLLLVQLEPRLGVSTDDLRPVDAIRSMRCPILIISGAEDVHTTVAQTQALFAAANAPKELWLVPGAAHVDLARYDPRGYEDRVLGFLERDLTDTEQGGRRR